jgi:hypothetical protein
LFLWSIRFYYLAIFHISENWFTTFLVLCLLGVRIQTNKLLPTKSVSICMECAYYCWGRKWTEHDSEKFVRVATASPYLMFITFTSAHGRQNKDYMPLSSSTYVRNLSHSISICSETFLVCIIM